MPWNTQVPQRKGTRVLPLRAGPAPTPVSQAGRAALPLSRPCPPPPGPWPSDPSTHPWACSPFSAPVSRALYPSSCASAETTWRSCLAWRRASGLASKSASTSSVADGGTAPPSTTAWPSSAPCWTKVRLPVEMAACGCSRPKPAAPLCPGVSPVPGQVGNAAQTS